MLESINLKLAKVKGGRNLRKVIRFYRTIFGEKNPGKINFKFSDKPSRLKVVQEIIEEKKFNSYLEIGTFDDELFSYVKCERKVGVDPYSGGTHRMTSDEFFLKNSEKFDCIFIDGLHHYKQVKKDIENSISILNDKGIIFLHDCLPNSVEAQAVPRTEVHWNGDVWKAFVEVRCKPFLDCYTCYADYGIGVILKRKNRNLLNIDNKNFEKLKFVEFYKDYKNLMNLILYDELKKII